MAQMDGSVFLCQEKNYADLKVIFMWQLFVLILLARVSSFHLQYPFPGNSVEGSVGIVIYRYMFPFPLSVGWRTLCQIRTPVFLITTLANFPNLELNREGRCHY